MVITRFADGTWDGSILDHEGKERHEAKADTLLGCIVTLTPDFERKD